MVLDVSGLGRMLAADVNPLLVVLAHDLQVDSLQLSSGVRSARNSFPVAKSDDL